MLAVTSKHHGNVNVITVVFQSLQTEGFWLLPHKPIPLPALKRLHKIQILGTFLQLAEPCSQRAQTATKRPATPESHTAHTSFFCWNFILKSKPLFLLCSWRTPWQPEAPLGLGQFVSPHPAAVRLTVTAEQLCRRSCITSQWHKLSR